MEYMEKIIYIKNTLLSNDDKIKIIDLDIQIIKTIDAPFLVHLL